MSDTPDEPPHDILAAEEFSVGAGDPTLHHGPVEVPDAPFTEGEPIHDVLAAEEFAMPAPRVGDAASDSVLALRPRSLGAVLAGAAAAVLVWRRRR